MPGGDSWCRSGGEKKDLTVARLKGSVTVSIGGVKRTLKDVLVAEAHFISPAQHAQQLLVGVRRFAKDTGLELRFPACGDTVEVYDGDECVVRAQTDDDDLYVFSGDTLDEVHADDRVHVSCAFERDSLVSPN